MLHPKVIRRLLRAWWRSKREKRAILPRDIWQAKGIIVGGLDTAIYRDDVTHYWGNSPFEYYGGTEGLVYALHSWTKKGLIFLPDTVFLEFLPYEEVLKLQEDRDYQPSTVLLNELEEGKLYEVVITQLFGMPLLRYRLGDIVQVAAMRDEEAGINLPHVVFQRRVGELIELAGMARLDEKTLWRAISDTGVKYADWVACKEYDQNQVVLHVYIELNEEIDTSQLEIMIDEQLKIIDTDYKDIDSYLGLQPVRVTRLSPGTFQLYSAARVKEGASIAHLKPTRINPEEVILKRLLGFSDSCNAK
jgi:phenylacetate-coenzyme A ligase PaaK-like adenylate-forming protein